MGDFGVGGLDPSKKKKKNKKKGGSPMENGVNGEMPAGSEVSKNLLSHQCHPTWLTPFSTGARHADQGRVRG